MTEWCQGDLLGQSTVYTNGIDSGVNVQQQVWACFYQGSAGDIERR